jgi:hypothetical protein
VVTLQDIRFKGTKYLDDILHAMDGGGGGAREGEQEVKPPSVAQEGYVWKRKELHKVKPTCVYHPHRSCLGHVVVWWLFMICVSSTRVASTYCCMRF